MKPGLICGASDDCGYNFTEHPISVPEFHETMLQCLGIDHTRWMYRFEGCDSSMSSSSRTMRPAFSETAQPGVA
jgi:Protein of unknown function (DUF1501)